MSYPDPKIPWTHVYTWTEFIEALHDANKQRNPKANNTSQSTQDSDWYGTYTYEQALEHLVKGWQTGLDRIRELRSTIPSDMYDAIMPVEDYKPEQRHQIAGGTLDVGSYITGASPENFIAEVIPHEAQDIVQGKKLITIYIQAHNSCHCSADAFFFRGLYTYYLIEHLENCGYSVEFWNVFTNNHEHGMNNKWPEQKIYVKVKEFGELFDTNKLAVTLCSQFYLRRYIFALMETYSDDEVKCTQDGYGYIPNKNKIEDVVLSEDADLNPLWIPFINIGESDKMLKEYKKVLQDYTEGGVIQC